VPLGAIDVFLWGYTSSGRPVSWPVLGVSLRCRFFSCTVASIMTKYTLSEKTVKAHLGSAYRPLSYKLDEDYIERKAFKGIRRIYRSDLLDGTLPGEVAEQESLVEEPSHVTEPRYIPIHNESMEQRIVYLYPNKRWVRTDVEDMVFVGMKGVNFRQGQRIWVKNKTLCIR
jgi:hypothetical protein